MDKQYGIKKSVALDTLVFLIPYENWEYKSL